MKYIPVNLVHVFLDFGTSKQKVGRLALKNRIIYFEYDPDFLQSGLLISPFQLPLKSGVHTADRSLFEGLHGVFNDSLPDGWGRLLLDRQIRKYGLEPGVLSPLDRLAHVGNSGMGALTYEPDHTETDHTDDALDLDKIARESLQVLEGEADEVLEELINLNGSSAGARPKVVVNISEDMKHIIHGSDNVPEGYSQWMIKFPMSGDPKNIAEMEYKYSQMARDAGLEMMPTYLFPAKKGAGYFGVKRFDRIDGKRLHMHTACGLLNADFRVPSMDYLDLLRATQILTKDIREVEKMFRLAVFNVLAHNQDDHSKNFSFLMDETGQWKASPAYDLTYSSGVAGEHSTMVMGKGKNITQEDVIALGEAGGLKKVTVETIYKQVKGIVRIRVFELKN